MEINKIYREDCRITMSKMPDNFIDLTVTSPPYDNLRTYTSEMEWNENVWKEIIKDLYRVTKVGGVVVWVVGDATIKGSETGTIFIEMVEEHHLEKRMVK
jgi:DNA modification methylase